MKKILSNFWPLIFILFVWFIFSSPYFIKNRVPFASTYQVNHFAPWDTYEKFWGPVKNGAMPDVIDQIYPWRHFTIESWRNGQVPLWNPYSFAGTPHLANYQSSAFSPFNLLFFMFSFIDAWSILVLLQPLLAGIFMYLLARGFRITKLGGLLTALSFMFCGFITVWMGYATLAYAIIFLPLSIFSIEKYYQTNKAKFLFILSTTIPLSFFSGHFQISLYFLIFTFIYIIYKFLSTRNILNTFYLALFACFGLLLSSPQIIPSIEFYQQSLRSDIFQKSETIPWQYLPTFIAPDFFGNPVTRNDWFGHYAEWNAYIGILPIMLAIYAILSKKRAQTFFLFILGIIVSFFAFKTPLLDILVKSHFPVLSTSSASRIIVIFSFVFCLLSGFGFDQLYKDIEKNKRKIILWLLGFFCLFISLWFIVALKLFMQSDKISIAKSNLIFPTLIFILISSSISVSLLRKRLAIFVFYFLIVVVAFDMLRFAMKWQPFDPKDLVFPNIPTTEAFSKISGYERVIGNFGAETSVYYHLPSLEGYDALYIRRYGEFIASLENGRVKESGRSVVSFPKDNSNTTKTINLLNVRYIVHKLADDYVPWTFPFWTYPKDQFKLIYKDEKYKFYENTFVYPHAFLTGEYKVLSKPQDIIDTILSKDFNLRKEIILEDDPKLPRTSLNIGTLKFANYTPNKIDLEIDVKNKGLLFLADNYYKGWEAKVDGRSVAIYRADYTFRAIPVFEGKHNVSFIYNPVSFKLGVGLGAAGLLGIIVMLFSPRILARLFSSFS